MAEFTSHLLDLVSCLPDSLFAALVGPWQGFVCSGLFSARRLHQCPFSPSILFSPPVLVSPVEFRSTSVCACLCWARLFRDHWMDSWRTTERETTNQPTNQYAHFVLRWCARDIRLFGNTTALMKRLLFTHISHVLSCAEAMSVVEVGLKR